ncbi:hypothetical protein JCM1840_000185 [Sporobolomyces johnsonii]
MQFLAKCSQLIDCVDGTTVEAVRVVDEYKCKAILCATTHAVETEDFTELRAWWGDEGEPIVSRSSAFPTNGVFAGQGDNADQHPRIIVHVRDQTDIIVRDVHSKFHGNVHTETAQFSLVPVDSVYAHETFTAFAASQQDLAHQGVTTTAPVYHSDTLPAGYAVVSPLKKLKRSEQHKGDPRIENKHLSARLRLFQRDNKLLRTEIDEQAAKIRRLEAFVPT